MTIIREPEKWRSAMEDHSCRGETVGFVPTMGALHAGHRSLLQRSRAESGIACASIFINPTQFDEPGDLSGYPVTLEEDIKMLKEEGTDYLFLPQAVAMYPDGFSYRVTERELSRRYCGERRVGHFDGMLTIVLKLLILTGADYVYMGEKDWQQYVLVHGMAKAFGIAATVVPCPTVREPSGLACSSRNVRLSEEGLRKAPLFPAVLTSGGSTEQMRRELEEAGFTVEYIEEFRHAELGDRLLAAVHLDGVRLIDNVRLSQEERRD
jgi:pantoate--beta-alanine ligase